MWLLGEYIHTFKYIHNANNRFMPFSVAEHDPGDRQELALNPHVKGMRTLL